MTNDKSKYNMKKNILSVAAICLMAMTAAYPVSAQPDYEPSPEIIEAQRQFRDNKFGIFIHWGIYSMYGQGEWALNYNGLTQEEYSKMARAFYPADFNAEQWVSAIKAAGAKYICITTRHHDGFSMFDSKCTDYDIVDATPFKRDIIGELAAECERQGITLHLYYSLIDWGRVDAPRGRTGQGTGRPEATDPDTYFDFMKCQLTELLTDYGKVGCIWFDGNWDHEDWEQPYDWRYDELYPLIHGLQPSCLIGNNHHITPYAGEDIQIFERDIPGENTAGWHSGGVSTTLPLETCQTMNGSWGYRMTDQNYKSTDELIHYLVSTAGRDANLLLNVGPQPNGEIPAAALERLAVMGQWLEKYGETIYGTRSTLVKPQPWGVTTHKDDRLWLHVFPSDAFKTAVDGQIYVPYRDGRKVVSVTPFGSDVKLDIKQYKEGLFVTLPEDMPADVPDYIVEITFR